MSMSQWNVIETLAREHHSQLLREAERERMVKLARSARKAPAPASKGSAARALLRASRAKVTSAWKAAVTVTKRGPVHSSG